MGRHKLGSTFILSRASGGSGGGAIFNIRGMAPVSARRQLLFLPDYVPTNLTMSPSPSLAPGPASAASPPQLTAQRMAIYAGEETTYPDNVKPQWLHMNSSTNAGC